MGGMNESCLTGNWRKASASAGTNCVEARTGPGGVEVRDSKNPGGPVLSYTPAEWEAFLHCVKRGEFDGLAVPAEPVRPSWALAPRQLTGPPGALVAP
jgi:Domain of unknown function (DUF397)